MRLHRDDISKIINKFPNIELSYEKTIHNKVPKSDIFLTIPKGKKHFAWFKHYKQKPVCIILELNRQRKKIEKIYVKHACFDELLCSGKGTIVYGTIFSTNDTTFFNIEDIFFMKGANISHQNQYHKWQCILSLFQNYIKQVVFHNSNLVFGLPIMDTEKKTLLEKIKNIPYSLYSIQHRLLYKRSCFLNERATNTRNYDAIFKIKATIDPDIYHLYFNDYKFDAIFYKIACIPDFKTSVFMNNLFRTIKENTNLDLLEESDDEEEFQDVSDDKYVDLDKEYLMKCVYMSYYKSWKPIEICNKKMCHQKDILKIEKYNAY
jgi:hypothetical protein